MVKKSTKLHGKTTMRTNLNRVTKNKNLRSILHPLILEYANTSTYIGCIVIMLSNQIDLYCFKQEIDIVERKSLYDTLFEKYLEAIIMVEEDVVLAIQEYRYGEGVWLVQYPWNKEEGIGDYL